MYKKIISLISQNKNIFITGSAGTGKSYILNKLQQDFHDLCVTASTGVAAINVSGSTIHSFAAIGYGIKTAAQIAYSMHHESKMKIKNCKRLAIDEISMLSAETFDLINNVFKIIRYNDETFGGIQLIVIGDFLQLPPVSKGNKEARFAFESEAWREANFHVIYLKKQYRQNDVEFLSTLNKIRFGEPIDTTTLIEQHDKQHDVLHLFPLNAPADEYNKYKLNEIKGQIYHFESIDCGDDRNIEKINKDCLVPRNLYLKIGARVMLLINKYIDCGLINGSIGTVADVFGNTVRVQFDNGVDLNLNYTTVARIVDRDKTKVTELASRSQIPLRLAYAVSIHKAQGLTLEKVFIDFSGTFECGQTYVALSRIKTRKGLSVVNLKPHMIKANKKAVAFYKKLE